MKIFWHDSCLEKRLKTPNITINKNGSQICPVRHDLNAFDITIPSTFPIYRELRQLYFKISLYVVFWVYFESMTKKGVFL